MIQVTKVKKVFHDNGVQVSAQAINMIRDDFNRHIRRMSDRCKDSNVKRLTNSTYHLAIGNLSHYIKSRANEKS